MAMFDFGRKPSWIENPPEGTMVTTAEAPTDNPFLGFEKANMQAFTKFMEDRGYQTGAIRGLQPNREVWYDNETGTAYALSDTSNATISGGKKLPPKKPATKAAPIKRVSPPRPSEPVRELDRDADLREQFIESQREFGAERIREALKQPTVDLAGLEPRSTRVTPTRPLAPIRERRASEDPLTDAISADGDDAIDMAGLEPRRRTRQAPAPTRESEQVQSPAPTLQSEQVAPSMEERKRRLIDADAGGLLRETATGKSDDQLLEQLMMDQLEIGENAKKVSMQNAPYEEQGPPAPVLNLGKSTDYEEQGPPTFMQQGRDVDIIGMDEAARTADRPRGLPTLQRDITNPDMSDDTVTADEEEVELDLEGMAPSPTLLQRIGNALKDNPELAASGAQLLGGLISNAAQNRAQRRADRTTDQRVARANLISAITGGRARPTVERAQADTGGFMSLDTLGKAFQGGGAAVKGELSRRVEEAERERKADLDERQMALREGQAESLAAYRAARAADGSGPPKIPAGIEKTIKQFDGSIKVIDQFLEQLENYDKEDEKDTTDTFQRAYQGLATRIPVLGSLVNPKAQQYTDQRSMLVGEVAKIINGGSGQVSNFDLELAENVVPDIRNPRDTGEFGIEKLNNLRKILDLRRSAFAEGYSESIYEDAASLVRGEEEGDEGAAEVTPESITSDQRSLLQRAREGDEEAVRQVRELGLI